MAEAGDTGPSWGEGALNRYQKPLCWFLRGASIVKACDRVMIGYVQGKGPSPLGSWLMTGREQQVYHYLFFQNGGSIVHGATVTRLSLEAASPLCSCEHGRRKSCRSWVKHLQCSWHQSSVEITSFWACHSSALVICW